ncbi:hypothetical protein HDV05_003104 [Chytridiales sp. JEL 0842]|nr:hypothetical protein HDV05_003104 [Chytridiales sp. JEL 0842]
MGNILSFSSPDVQSLRQKAKEKHTEADKYYQLSQDAWNSNNKALAAEYKAKRIAAQEEAKKLNNQAAQLCFEERNKGRDPFEVDLHGLHTSEALAFVEQRLVQAKRNKQTHLIIITGKGNNSADGVAKLKPAVYNKLMQRHGLRCEMDRPNSGCVYVEFVEDKSLIGWVVNGLGSMCVVM